MGELSCSDEDYRYLQRLRDRLISTKILFREAEKHAEFARKAGLIEEAEREESFAREYMNLLRQMEDQVKKLEARIRN
jgi:hypothetical protein